MYISTVIFLVIYITDIVCGFFIAGTTGAFIVAFGLPVGIMIQLRLAIFKTDAMPLEHLSPHDREKLSVVFENVLRRAEQNGYTFHTNPKIYLSEDRSMNGFNAGNAIVINRGLMNSGCLEAVCAHEIKHWRFNDSYTSCLICNTVTILSLLVMFVLSIYAFVAVLLVGIIIGIFSRGTIGFIAGTLIGKLIGKINEVILKINLFIMRALQALLSRFVEFKADEFATKLGYGEQLKQFLRLNSERRNTENLTSKLLATHPSDSRRIGRIQRIQNQMGEREGFISLPFNI